MQAENAAQPPRNYIGASRLGEECLRKLGYEFHHNAPKDEGREFKGRTLRIFERGHTGEDAMARRLRLAGFQIVTHRPDGGSRSASAPAGTRNGLLHHQRPPGRRDYRAPYEAALLPRAVGEQGAGREVVQRPREEGRPRVEARLLRSDAALHGLPRPGENPGLFTAENGNTGEIYAEKVAFDRAAAQAASDKGVRVVTSRDPEELPRVATKPTDFRCKLCDYPGAAGLKSSARSDYEHLPMGSFGARG
jgi:hypothetical protein